MTEVPTTDADLAAYKKAQKMRNLYIGGGLLLFVVLVFVVSMVRMSEGMRHDRERKLSNVPLDAVSASASHS